MQSKPCDDVRYDPKTWPPPDRRASACFFLPFLRCGLDAVMGIFPSLLSFPRFVVVGDDSRHFRSHATLGICIFNLPPPVLPPRQRRLLAGTSPHRRGTKGATDGRLFPRDWIAFLDGQSRSAASLPPSPPTLLSPEPSVLSAGFAVVPFSHHLTLPTRRLFLCGYLTGVCRP